MKLRLLILLATVVLVGCPKDAYKVAEPYSANGYCATKEDVVWASPSTCSKRGGKLFGDQKSARKEQERLAGNVWCVDSEWLAKQLISSEDCRTQKGITFLFEAQADRFLSNPTILLSVQALTPLQGFRIDTFMWVGTRDLIRSNSHGFGSLEVGQKVTIKTKKKSNLIIWSHFRLQVDLDAFEGEQKKFKEGDLDYEIEKVAEDYFLITLIDVPQPPVASPTPESQPTVSSTPESQPTVSSTPESRLVGTGTGFFVSGNYVVTANHVLRATDDVSGRLCNAASILFEHKEYEATIADTDVANDLGLLKVDVSSEGPAKLRNNPDLRVGEAAINYGFPLTGDLSNSAKLNAGTVNSLAGVRNNSAMLQYDAATQFGNSGGPVMDAAGNVIGVVRSGFDDSQTQLVNFATKSTILEGFLKANKVPFEKADLTEELKLPDIAEKAEAFTVLVGCWE